MKNIDTAHNTVTTVPDKDVLVAEVPWIWLERPEKPNKLIDSKANLISGDLGNFNLILIHLYYICYTSYFIVSLMYSIFSSVANIFICFHSSAVLIKTKCRS